MRQNVRQIVWIEPEAPPKPAVGDDCNGCGLCCLAQPCPVGMLVSLKASGRCSALEWNAGSKRYVCNLVASPETVWRWMPPSAARFASRVARRFISSGSGCDADIAAEPPAP